MAGPGAVGLRVGPQYVFAGHHLYFAGVDVSRVPRVAEPDAALPVDGKVVGCVERLSVQRIDYGSRAAVGLEAHDGTSAGAATVEAAVNVKSQAVGVVGVVPVHFTLAGLGVIGHDPAAGDVSEQKLVSVPRWSFRQTAEWTGYMFPFQFHDFLLIIVDLILYEGE